MSKYYVYFTTTASFSVEVEADSEDEAVEQAEVTYAPSLCAQCSGWGQGPGIDLGEWDVDEIDEVPSDG